MSAVAVSLKVSLTAFHSLRWSLLVEAASPEALGALSRSEALLITKESGRDEVRCNNKRVSMSDDELHKTDVIITEGPYSIPCLMHTELMFHPVEELFGKCRVGGLLQWLPLCMTGQIKIKMSKQKCFPSNLNCVIFSGCSLECNHVVH